MELVIYISKFRLSDFGLIRMHCVYMLEMFGDIFHTYHDTSFFSRKHSPGINVDLHDSIQPATSMFYSRSTTRVAFGSSLYICWLHLYHNYNHPLSFITLGPKCCAICSMGWLHSKYVTYTVMEFLNKSFDKLIDYSTDKLV
jgi:hypothetical protein